MRQVFTALASKFPGRNKKSSQSEPLVPPASNDKAFTFFKIRSMTGLIGIAISSFGATYVLMTLVHTIQASEKERFVAAVALPITIAMLGLSLLLRHFPGKYPASEKGVHRLVSLLMIFAGALVGTGALSSSKTDSVVGIVFGDLLAAGLFCAEALTYDNYKPNSSTTLVV